MGAIAGTIAGYEIAKARKKDTFYYTLLGGFIGMVIGNAISDVVSDDTGKLTY